MTPLFSALFSATLDFLKGGRKGTESAIKSIVCYPLKALATLVFAPILAIRVASFAKNPVSRFIAGFGFVAAIGIAYIAGTFVGKATFALFMFSKFGFFVGLGVFIGSLMSVIVSAFIIALAFNVTCLLFLKMSSEDVIAHLRSVSE